MAAISTKQQRLIIEHECNKNGNYEKVRKTFSNLMSLSARQSKKTT